MAQSRRILLCFCYIVGASVYTSIAIDMALDSAVIFRKTSSACTCRFWSGSDNWPCRSRPRKHCNSYWGCIYARYINGAFTADGDCIQLMIALSTRTVADQFKFTIYRIPGYVAKLKSLGVGLQQCKLGLGQNCGPPKWTPPIIIYNYFSWLSRKLAFGIPIVLELV